MDKVIMANKLIGVGDQGFHLKEDKSYKKGRLVIIVRLEKYMDEGKMCPHSNTLLQFIEIDVLVQDDQVFPLWDGREESGSYIVKVDEENICWVREWRTFDSIERTRRYFESQGNTVSIKELTHYFI